ncbi:hypothetical protein OIU74_019341 [Salix koriyanagi]|uniref:Glycosyltransferase family 92 protein n=1 Tax=Salix koriyanagi TaxID=2511006 RepID=A0A9Q0SKK5_9ROSI|nr:hypothetical protein OIU74_019341 [Salix koriyanagi]
MRKDCQPPASGATVSKLPACFETKPLVATLLALTLVMLLWNLPPYYQNLLSTTTRPSCSAPEATVSLSNTSSSFTRTSLSDQKWVHTEEGRPPLPWLAWPRSPFTCSGVPWYKCEWISNNGSSIRAKGYKMLPDWGYGRVYTVVVVNCSFPVNPNRDNAGGRLMLNAYYDESQRKYEKLTALEELPGSYNESKFHPPYQYDSHFVFHDAGGVSPEVRAALDPWVRAGRATIQDIRGQAEFDGYYYNQFLVVNDCLHRYRYSANWTFYFDFTIEQNPMSSALCFNDSTQDYPRQWGFEKLLFRESRSGIRRDRKYAIQARNAYATGVHMSENVIGKTLHQTETKIRYYHYHNSIQVLGELCREFLPLSAKNNVTWYNKLPYVFDDNMKKLASTIKEFERNTIGNVQVYS